MGWSEVSIMSTRREFVKLATQEDANVRELSRRYGISPTTAYKWMERGAVEGEAYEDRSRRPLRSPNRTDERIEQKVLAIRDAHPVWNARKIRRLLKAKLDEGERLPAASTVGQILRRHGRIREEASAAAHAWHRFEHDAPNELSQIDFKGHFATGEGRCYPLTMIDDHSRYSQILKACTNERTETVKAHLIDTFRRFGLPKRMNMDNGNPWGNPTGERYTKLTVWLIRLGWGSAIRARCIHRPTARMSDFIERSRPKYSASAGSRRWPKCRRRSMGGERSTTTNDRMKRWDWKFRPHVIERASVAIRRFCRPSSTRPRIWSEAFGPTGRCGLRVRTTTWAKHSRDRKWRSGPAMKMGCGTYSSATSGWRQSIAATRPLEPASATEHGTS